MSIAEEYKERITPFRAIFHYQEEVERIAREAFWAFNEEERTYFGELLACVYGRNSRIYDTLHTNYEAIKAGKRNLSKSDVHYLVSAILPCLPAVLQYECLQYEVLHTIQKQRIALNHEGFRRVSVDKAFDIYNQYTKSILHLHNTPSQWFHVESYTESERQEIIRCMQYVLMQKIKTSVNRFAEDLRTLAQHYKALGEDTVYFIELLAVEVTLSSENWSSEQTISDDIDLPLPTPAGKFASFLKEYLVKELENDNAQNSLQTIQNSLLAHDLSATLMQYKPKGFWRKKATISFLLQGGAGILKIETSKVKSWFNRLNVREQIFIGVMGTIYSIPMGMWLASMVKAIIQVDTYMIFELMSVLAISCVGLGIATAFFYALYFLFFEFVYVFVRLIDAPIIAIEAEQDQRIANKILIEDYNKLVAQRRTETDRADNYFKSPIFLMLLKRDDSTANVYEAISAHLHTHARKKLHTYYEGYTQVQFSTYLGIYRKMADFITALSIKNLPENLLVGVAYEEKYQLLKAMQNILMHRLFRSFQYVLEVGKHTLNQNMDIHFYATFLDFDLSAQGEARCMDKYKAQIAKITKHFEEYLPTLDASTLSPALQTWFEKEKNLLQGYHFGNEAVQIKQQITLQQKHKRNKQFTVIPLILESEEGVLYV